MSQPPLSQQIRALEEEVGATLLLRNQRRVELTAAGAAFLERAREILAAVEDAARQARRVQRGEVGRLAVGFVGSAMYSFVPELLRAFREQCAGHRAAPARARARASSCASSRTAGSTSASCALPRRAARAARRDRARGAGRGRAARRCTRSPQRPLLRARRPRGRAAGAAHAAPARPGLRAALAGAIDRARRRGADRAGGGGDADRDRPRGRGRRASRSCRSRCARWCATGVTYRPLDGDAPAVRLEMAWRASGRVAGARRVPGDGARGGPRRRRERSAGAGATIDVAATPGRRDMYRRPLRGGEPPSRREEL